MLRDKKSGRRRFTLSHECARRIISRYGKAKCGSSSRKNSAAGRRYSRRDLHRVSNWEDGKRPGLDPRLCRSTSISGFRPYSMSWASNRRG